MIQANLVNASYMRMNNKNKSSSFLYICIHCIILTNEKLLYFLYYQKVRLLDILFASKDYFNRFGKFLYLKKSLNKNNAEI